MNCQACGSELSAGDKFCPQCGAPISPTSNQRISIPADVAKRAQGFAGRLWVLAEVVDWIAHRSERFMLITGEPGCGKTALAAWLAGAGPAPDDRDASQNLERLRDGWSAAHFCMAEGKRGTLNPTRFAQSLACQLSNRYGEYAKAVLRRTAPEIRIEQQAHENWGRMVGAQIDTLVVGTSAEDIHNRLVREPLEVLLSHQLGLRILVLVDALDEALTFGYPNIVTLLAGSDDLHAGVRFLLTSRNEPKVLDQFRQVRRLDLSGQEHTSEADADIRTYVTRRISESAIKPHRTAAGSPETTRERLVEQAAGNFLYIQFLLDEVAAGKRSLADLASLPSGLFGLYCAYLDRLMPDMLQVGASQRWVKQFQPLLGCLSVAVSAVPREALPGWLGYPESEVEALLNDLIQLVEYDQDGYRLYHRSMAEFLAVKEYQDNGVSKRNRYYAPPHEQHERIARYYLNAWAGLGVWLPGLQEHEKWELDGGYGLRHVVEHLVEAEGVEDALSIIKPGLREAKRLHLGTDFSFVHDLEVILGYLEERGQADGLPAAIRCSLIHSLLTNLMDTLPPEVLSALVWLGGSNRALELATLSPDSEEKVARFLAIAQALRQSGADAEIPERILQEALRTTRSLTQVAEGTQDLLRVRVAKQVAHLDWDWSQRILAEIEHPYIRAQSKMAVAAEVAEDETKAIGLLREVLPTITGSSPLLWDFSIALGKAAQHHLGAIQSLIRSIGDQCLQDLIRREVAKQLLENNECHLALSIAKEIREPTESMTVLGHIANCLAEENVEEAYRVLEDISPAEKGSRALLDCIGALSPEHAEFALNIANRIVDTSERCRALAQTALLFARVHDIDKAQAILKSVRNIADQLPPSDVSLVFLLATIGETIAEIALVDEGIAREMIAEWESISIKGGQYIANSVCRLLLDRDAELTLRLVELITHPYLKGILLARAVFRLAPDDPRVLTLREHIRELMKVVTDEECRRQQQAYLLASEGVGTPERLLSIWEKETEPGIQEAGLATEIVIGPSGVDYPATEDAEQRDDVLIGLALDVAHRNADQALVVLRAVLDHNRQIRGLAQLAHLLSRRIGTTDLDDEGQASRLRHRNSLIDDVSVACIQLLKHDVQLASRIVEAVPDRSEQARAYAAMALSLRDRDFEQSQRFLERALAIGQARPESALRPMAYLELDRCIPEENQEVDLVKKVLSSVPVDSIPAAVPEVTRRIVTHLAAKGKEEVALRIAERMPATHTLLDIPDKMRALLGITEHAIEHQKPSVGKEALGAALDILRLSSYEAPSLPRLASLMRHYDPALAEQLFDNAVEIAMSRQMYGPSRFQILGGVAHFRAPFNIQSALDAARKISDPHIRADALMSAVTRGNIPVEKKPEVTAEVQTLLASDSGDAIAKGRALLKMVDAGAPERLNPRDLLWNVVQTARLAQPADWFKRIGLLTEVYHLFEDLGDQKAAEEVLSEALDTARNDPFNQAVCMAQVAQLYLSRDRSRAILILYEILMRARLEGYDAVWRAITAIISVICEVGGNTLAQHVYEELNIAEEFLSDRSHESCGPSQVS